jgi:hypothetical protein
MSIFVQLLLIHHQVRTFLHNARDSGSCISPVSALLVINTSLGVLDCCTKVSLWTPDSPDSGGGSGEFEEEQKELVAAEESKNERWWQ